MTSEDEGHGRCTGETSHAAGEEITEDEGGAE